MPLAGQRRKGAEKAPNSFRDRGVFSLHARHPGEGRDPVYAEESPLDAGYVIPNVIRDRHDDNNTPMS